MSACRLPAHLQALSFEQIIGRLRRAGSGQVLGTCEQVPGHSRQVPLNDARVRQRFHMASYGQVNSGGNHIHRVVAHLLDQIHLRVLRQKVKHQVLERKLGHTDRAAHGHAPAQ